MRVTSVGDIAEENLTSLMWALHLVDEDRKCRQIGIGPIQKGVVHRARDPREDDHDPCGVQRSEPSSGNGARWGCGVPEWIVRCDRSALSAPVGTAVSPSRTDRVWSVSRKPQPRSIGFRRWMTTVRAARASCRAKAACRPRRGRRDVRVNSSDAPRWPLRRRLGPSR